MGLMSFKRGQGSIILRVKILDSSVSTGAGKTGLAFNTSGLIISTIADNEASATTYTVAGSTIENITTLGTYATPTATKCRFKEVDSTNHKGVYEIQIADARYAVSSAKSLLVSILGASNAAETDVLIPLQDLDPYDTVRAGLTALPNAVAGASGGLPLSVDTSGRVDVLKINGTSQTARDLGASVLLSSGTGTGQVKLSSGYVAPNWGDVGNPTTTVGLTGTTIAATQKVDVETIKTQTVTCGAGVTVSPYVGSTGAAVNGTNANTLSSHDPGATIGTSTYAGGAISGITGVTFPATVGDATLANQTTILARLGSWTGSGLNTILGAFRALMAKAAALTPTDISTGTTFDNTTDSAEALRDRGDAAWITATGFSTHSAADVKTAMEADGTKLDHLWEMTEDDGGVRRYTTNALEQAPVGTTPPTVVAIADEVETRALILHADYNAAKTAASQASVDSIPADVITAMGTGTFLTAVPWNAAWDAEVESEVQDAIEVNHLDHLLAVTYDPAAKPGAADALLNELIGDDGGVSQFTANALALASGTGASAEDLIEAMFTYDATGTYGTADAGSLVKQIADNTTIGDKTGFSLAADGLDLVLIGSGGSTKTLPDTLTIIAAAMAGELSGALSGTEIVYSWDGVTPIATATIDADGNRTTMVYEV